MVILARERRASDAAYDFLEEPRQFRCHIAVLREADGSFSAIVLNLPGAGSCGDSEEEAVDNACEAVRGAVESYEEAGERIPWITEYSVPEGAKLRRFLVDA